MVSPYTIPEVRPIVAIVVFALLYVPPLSESLSVVVAPITSVSIPVITEAIGLTVIVALPVMSPVHVVAVSVATTV